MDILSENNKKEYRTMNEGTRHSINVSLEQ
jgi:hypothetical protein